MKHIHTFESFLNEAKKTEEVIKLKNFSNTDHTRLVKWMTSEFGLMKYNPGMQWTGGHLTRGGDFTLDVSDWNERDLEDLKAYLKSQHHVFESVNEAALNESVVDKISRTDLMKIGEKLHDICSDYRGSYWQVIHDYAQTHAIYGAGARWIDEVKEKLTKAGAKKFRVVKNGDMPILCFDASQIK